MTTDPEQQATLVAELDQYDQQDDGFGEPLPIRPRRPFLTRWTALLMALALGGAGFYAGVRIEKTHVSSAGGSSARAAAFTGTGGKSAAPGARPSGLSGGVPGSVGGGTIGTVSSVKGDTIYVKESSGDTVAVKLSGSTTVKKTESVSKTGIYPGDEVVVTGTSGAGGTVSATAVTDSGSTGSSSSRSTSTGSSSVTSSLFGG